MKCLDEKVSRDNVWMLPWIGQERTLKPQVEYRMDTVALLDSVPSSQEVPLFLGLVSARRHPLENLLPDFRGWEIGPNGKPDKKIAPHLRVIACNFSG
jgi:hypothetical protein